MCVCIWEIQQSLTKTAFKLIEFPTFFVVWLSSVPLFSFLYPHRRIGLLLLSNWFGDSLVDPQVKLLSDPAHQLSPLWWSSLLNLLCILCVIMCGGTRDKTAMHLVSVLSSPLIFALLRFLVHLHLRSLNLQLSWNVFVYLFRCIWAFGPGEL